MNVWALLNILLVALAGWMGYSEMAPENLSRTNPDLVFCGATFFGAIAFSLGAVWYSVGAGQQTLRPASWRRFSAGWWCDPMQCLFLASCCAGAMEVGAAFRLRDTSDTAFWMVMFFNSLFLGLVVGQLAVYWVFRKHITTT